MNKALISTVTLAALALLGPGCANDSGYVPMGQSRVSDLGAAGLKIVGRIGVDGSITAPDSNLRKIPGQDIYFENIAGRRLANGFTEISVATSNKSSLNTINIQYSIHWYDAQGLEIHPENAGWSTLVLKPRDIGAIRGVSPTKDAASVTILVREITYTK